VKILPVAVDCSMRTGSRDRQTDMTELIVHFRNFANAPKKMQGVGLKI
jgi:hypothetical protein